MNTHDTIINHFFKGKYLIPTDNIRQQSDCILNEYIEMMRNKQDVPAIHVATEFSEELGHIVPVSELVQKDYPIYIIDGHHRYIAWLANKDYPLMAKFVDRVTDKREVHDLYDYLDAYEWAEKQ